MVIDRCYGSHLLTTCCGDGMAKPGIGPKSQIPQVPAGSDKAVERKKRKKLSD
jgi:hypothetical protein